LKISRLSGVVAACPHMRDASVCRCKLFPLCFCFSFFFLFLLAAFLCACSSVRLGVPRGGGARIVVWLPPNAFDIAFLHFCSLAAQHARIISTLARRAEETSRGAWLLRLFGLIDLAMCPPSFSPFAKLIAARTCVYIAPKKIASGAFGLANNRTNPEIHARTSTKSSTSTPTPTPFHTRTRIQSEPKPNNSQTVMKKVSFPPFTHPHNFSSYSTACAMHISLSLCPVPNFVIFGRLSSTIF